MMDSLAINKNKNLPLFHLYLEIIFLRPAHLKYLLGIGILT